VVLRCSDGFNGKIRIEGDIIGKDGGLDHGRLIHGELVRVCAFSRDDNTGADPADLVGREEGTTIVIGVGFREDKDAILVEIENNVRET